MSTTHDTQNAEIERSEMPLGSFRYGQYASFEGVDAPLDAWLVCTHCAKPKRDDDNGASGFDDVLVVHFMYRDESEARECVSNISLPTVLVRPVSTTPTTHRLTVWAKGAKGIRVSCACGWAAHAQTRAAATKLKREHASVQS